jgi:hypothetical protein
MTTALPPESLLVGHIRAHIKQGEKAKERADQAREKAEQHFIAAGRHLMTLKAHYAADWAAWELLLKTKVDISTGRASELMQLADGRKDLQQIRDATAQRVKALRASRSSSLQGRCNEDDTLISTDNISTHNIRPHNIGTHNIPSSGSKNGGAHQLIDALVASSSGSREAAANLLISGPRQSQFTTTVKAVADFYVLLSRAGR